MSEQLTIEEAIANRDGILHLIAGDPMRSPSVRAVATAIAETCPPDRTWCARGSDPLRAHHDPSGGPDGHHQ